MSEPTANRVVQRADDLRNIRSPYETRWREIAKLLRPIGQGFGDTRTTQGESRMRDIYDSSPLLTLDHFKSGLFGSMTSPSNKWFELTTGDDDLNQREDVKQWTSVVTERLRASFGTGVSAFYKQVAGFYADIGAFGTAVFWTQEKTGKERIIDRTRALHECYIDVNDLDEVDCVYRRFFLTARQAVMQFPTGLPEKIITASKSATTQGQKFEFIHAIEPNPDFNDRARQAGKNRSFIEHYVTVDTTALVETNYYYEMPYQVARWDMAAGEHYGRGPGEVALADIQSLNMARRTNLTVADRAARPVLLAHSELDINGGVRAYPGKVVYGGIDADGRKRVQPLDEGKRLDVALEMESQLRDAVKDAFYFGLMQITGSRDMTATEFLGRDNERLRLLGPHLGNIQVEFLGPQIKRRYGILSRAGQLPDPPEALSGAAIDVRYISPLARLQRQQEAEAAMKTIVGFGQAAQIGVTGVLDRVDADKLAEALEGGFGSDILNSREDAQKAREQRQQQEQMIKAAELAPGVASAAKDVSEIAQAPAAA